MNITILALGSRGDVQPAVALGVGLRRAGFTVRLGSYAKFADMAAQHGLAFQKIEGDITAVLQSDAGKEMLNSRNPLKLGRVMRDSLRQTYFQAAQDVIAACANAEAIVSVGVVYYAAASVAEARQIPLFQANLQPLLESRAFPNALLPLPPVQTGLVNRLTHPFSEQIFWELLRPIVNKSRQELFHLPPFPYWRPITRHVQQGLPTFFAFSPQIIPKPDDWPVNAHVTGYWFLDNGADWQPPPHLLNFLADGDPPVYIGFGSMNNRDPQATAELVIEALQLTGQRGILLSGWGGLHADDVPASILLVDSVPHDWLFPRMAAVVHHGGAGTTAAGLQAGVPSILVPFFADQPFWAQYVQRLKVGPTPIPRKMLMIDKLAGAIETAVTNRQIKQDAAAIGEKIRAEDGVGRAVALMQQVLTKFAGKSTAQAAGFSS